MDRLLPSAFLCVLLVVWPSIGTGSGLLVQAKPDDYVLQQECFHWYSEAISGVVKEPKDKEMDVTESYEFDPKNPQATVDCIRSPHNRTLTIEFSDKQKRDASVKLKLVFQIKGVDYWELDDKKSEVILTNGSDTTFNGFRNSEVTAGSTFSFSCADLTLRSQLKDEKTLKLLKVLELRFTRFQVQPFNMTKESGKFFEDSFDCTTWFTIPIWIGFLVTLLFTAILSFGIYALLEIKTPDRFENPKGKTITVNTSD